MEHFRYYSLLPTDITADEVDDIFAHHGWQVKLPSGLALDDDLPGSRHPLDDIEERPFFYGRRFRRFSLFIGSLYHH